MVEWFPLLVKRGDAERNALFARCAFRKNREFAVCHNDGKRKRFAKFDGYAHLFHHIAETPEEERCFFEVIEGDAMQKMYFDIDMPFDSLGTLTVESAHDAVLKLAQAACDACGGGRQLVFSSSHATDKSKISYHIVVDGVWFPSNIDVRNAVIGFINSQRGKIPDAVLDSIDTKVYKSVQQFRILNCHKYGSGRVKKLVGDFVSIIGDRDKRHPSLALFAASLITEVSLCKPLPLSSPAAIFASERTEKRRLPLPRDVETAGLVDYGEVSAALAAIVKTMAERGADAPFEIRDDIFSVNQDGLCMVSLTRRAPSFCPVCARVHECENPFLFVNTASKNAILNCRRAAKNSQHVSANYSVCEEAANYSVCEESCSCVKGVIGAGEFVASCYTNFFGVVDAINPKRK